MAHLHGDPGKYSKGVARQKAIGIFSAGLTLVALYSFGVGVLFALVGTFWIWIALPIAGVLVWVILRLIDKPMNWVSRERLKYLRGAQGEVLVGWMLHELGDEWHVFHGMKLEEARDIDHVVVGPGGSYCISTKSFRGLLSLSPDGQFLMNNEPSKLLEQTFMQAMNLRDRLKFGMGADVPFVVPVLAVPFMFVAFQSPQRNVWVVHQGDLTDVMEKAPNKMSKDEVKRCVTALEMLEKNAATIHRPAMRE